MMRVRCTLPRLVLGGCLLACVALLIHVHDVRYFQQFIEVPMKQQLNLVLNLPKNITNRDVLVKQYIENLQQELHAKDRKPYKDQDDAIYKQRKLYVTTYCKNRKDQNLDLDYIAKATWYLKDPAVMYCPVAKGGSTFWRRAIEVIRRKDPKIVSPFQLSYLDFKVSAAKISSQISKDVNQMTSLLNSTLKYVFARDPYHRVFSTFIDKMLSPLTMMWGWGKKAADKFSPAREKNKCGADVTFREFVKIINSVDPKTLDHHLRPVAYTCDVCKIDYDVIGKMETFQADTIHILKTSGSLDKYISFRDMSTEYKVDYIVDQVIRAFVFKGGWQRCISVHAGLNRLWRQLQISGLIDKTDIYSLTPAQSEVITVSEYLDLALAAFKRSTPAAKRNKQEAYMQAYSTIEAEDLDNLRKSFLADFEMFDYEQKPAELFSELKAHDISFDYFDVMRMK